MLTFLSDDTEVLSEFRPENKVWLFEFQGFVEFDEKLRFEVLCDEFDPNLKHFEPWLFHILAGEETVLWKKTTSLNHLFACTTLITSPTLLLKVFLCLSSLSIAVVMSSPETKTWSKLFMHHTLWHYMSNAIEMHHIMHESCNWGHISCTRIFN